jgi:hypothetical protein
MVVVSFSDIDGENKEQGENHQHVSSTMAVHRYHIAENYSFGVKHELLTHSSI